MIEKINLENYEAFYLDYLENNLSEEDRVLFELFLENHPELVEEDIITTPLSETYDNQLSLGEKQTLKVFTSEEKINQLNLEDFIIAYHEGMLDQVKTNELLIFLQQSPTFADLFNSYKKIKLEPDYSIQFPSKNALKRGKNRTLFYLISGVAAMFACILYFSQLNQEKTVVVSTNQPTKNTTSHTSLTTAPLVKTAIKYVAKRHSTVEHIEITQEIDTIQPTENIEISQPENSNLIATNQPPISSISIEKSSINPTPNINENAYLSFSDMKKPIEVVTQFLPDEYAKFIDIRYAKTTESKQGGFYIKIGDFQFSRKKSPDQNLSSR